MDSIKLEYEQAEKKYRDLLISDIKDKLKNLENGLDIKLTHSNELCKITQINSDGTFKVNCDNSDEYISELNTLSVELLKEINNKLTLKELKDIIKGIKKGDIDKVISVLENDNDSIVYLNTILNTAIDYNYLKIVKILVEQKGIDITSRDNLAVRIASEKGFIDIIDFLIEHGADITAESNLAVRIACQNNDLKTIEFLVANGADITDDNNSALRVASASGHLDVVKYLVSLKADVQDNNNEAVEWACYNNYPNTVKYLISEGADITVNDNQIILNSISNKKEHILEILFDELMKNHQEQIQNIVEKLSSEQNTMLLKMLLKSKEFK